MTACNMLLPYNTLMKLNSTWWLCSLIGALQRPILFSHLYGVKPQYANCRGTAGCVSFLHQSSQPLTYSTVYTQCVPSFVRSCGSFPRKWKVNPLGLHSAFSPQYHFLSQDSSVTVTVECRGATLKAQMSVPTCMLETDIEPKQFNWLAFFFRIFT